MATRTLSRLWISILILLAAAPVWADTQFRTRKMTRDDVPLGRGQCDIWLYVDNEVEVTVRGDMVFVRTLSGRDSRDGGSECNAPLPNRDIHDFHFEEADSRAEMRLLAEPARRNNFQAVVGIRDPAPGECHCHFRLTWTMADDRNVSRRDPDDFRRDGDDRRGGLAWNNTTHFAGPGHGSSALSGYGAQRLFDVSVDIDRGNRILVSFRTDSGRRLSFSGTVIGADGDTLRADMATDDQARLRGSMYISRNPRGEVYRITLDATNGQDRLGVDWNGR
jgi:hypothetical protein